MSNALVDNIGNASGSLITPTQYVVRGSAKAWGNLNGTGTIALRDSLNVSSVVDNGTGVYTNNLTNAMSDADYAAAGYCGRGSGSSLGRFVSAPNGIDPTASTFRLTAIDSAGNAQDSAFVYVSNLGDLA